MMDAFWTFICGICTGIIFLLLISSIVEGELVNIIVAGVCFAVYAVVSFFQIRQTTRSRIIVINAKKDDAE